MDWDMKISTGGWGGGAGAGGGDDDDEEWGINILYPVDTF